MKKILIIVLTFLFLPNIVGCSSKYKDRETSLSSEDDAILTIFADNGDSDSKFLFKQYGHAFLTITNVGTRSFIVGDRQVQPDETITIGLWPIKEHFGVWFNLESNYINEYNKYSQRVSISIGIDLKDIDKITELIDENDKWNVFFNCSKFAVKTWNLVAEENEKIEEKFFVSPNYLHNEIKFFKDYKFAEDIKTSNFVSFYKEG